jgi:hypothetical protein
VGCSHSVCHDCRGEQHDRHKSTLGHQDSLYGSLTPFSLRLQMTKNTIVVITDPVGRRDPVPSHSRRHSHHIPCRGFTSFLPRTSPQLVGHSPRRCSVPSLRADEGLGKYALSFFVARFLPTLFAEHSDGTPLSTTQILLCSGGSKLFASTATYPHEVVRTRLQIARHAADGTTARPGLISTVRDILTHEGGRGLYKGFSVNLLRTVPNSAVTMLTYVQCELRSSSND